MGEEGAGMVVGISSNSERFFFERCLQWGGDGWGFHKRIFLKEFSKKKLRGKTIGHCFLKQ